MSEEPYHASWLNQIEVYFSILQRKALTPKDFASLDALGERIMAFQHHWQQVAEPFDWNFTRRDLDALMARLAARDTSLRLVAERPQVLAPTPKATGLRSLRMEPTPSRPHLPRGYGIEKATGAPGQRLPWNRVSEWLTAARNYWVCTTRPDGRPHAKPVWGVWLEDQLLFSTHPETISARNLKANPALVLHLESGDQVVIVEGTAMRLDGPALLARFGEEYQAKYDWPLSREDLDPANPDAAFYAVRPRVVLSWGTATEIGETITRWNFDRSG